MPFCKKSDIISALTRPVGQAVKTLASHAGNMGSIPVRVINKKQRSLTSVFCLFPRRNRHGARKRAWVRILRVSHRELAHGWHEQKILLAEQIPVYGNRSLTSVFCLFPRRKRHGARKRAWVRILRVSHMYPKHPLPTDAVKNVEKI